MAPILQPASPLWRGTSALQAHYEMHQGHEKAAQIHQQRRAIDFHPQSTFNKAVINARLVSLAYDSKHRVCCQLNLILPGEITRRRLSSRQLTPLNAHLLKKRAALSLLLVASFNPGLSCTHQLLLSSTGSPR